MSWCISHPRRLVIAVAKGELDPQDMMEFVTSVDAANARPYRKMVDVTGVTALFSADKIRRFARLIRQREDESEVGAIGVVAGSPDVHRQAVLFTKQAQRYRPIRVFHEQHDARKWLDAIGAEAKPLRSAYTVRLNAMEMRTSVPR
jgi:stage II sporulation SpoAA-like protein